ncbi:MAG: hypothetical protein CVU77_02105 [Elusimicrobia bacterium HGW-Elusimicrobia-1]|jgi:molybdopterin converting factor small subunit|nr:MAG: hypothetical protein CVU77_02105 [Elusimicrobia bacterium HGW-Elusimicrobia-1]
MTQKHKITVKFYPPLKETLGVGSVTITARDAGEAIEILSGRFGKKFTSEVLEDDGSVKNYFILLLDGKAVDQKNPAASKFVEGSVLHVLPPVAGG